VPVTRRQLLGGAAATAALGAAGVYELVDRLGSAPPRSPARALPLEQHVLEGVQMVRQDGVEVLVPPLHHQVVTAVVAVPNDPAKLGAAKGALEQKLQELERRYEPTPAGLGITVAWGLPYFRHFVPQESRRYLPLDHRASKARGKPVSALLDAVRFPSDPQETILERNDVAVLIRSDNLAAIEDAAKAVFDDIGVLHPTSIRKGFAGGGFEGGQSLPKKMAVAAGVPGADLIPDSSELFLGFTSTQRAALGAGRIANLETLGYSDGGREGYFSHGTHMHLSHVAEDLEAWYLNFTFQERAATAFRPGQDVKPGVMAVAQSPRDAASIARNVADYRREGSIGHSSSIQTASRLQGDVVGPDGTRFRKGTAIPQRADFNTLDNPFFWSADPERDGYDPSAAAGVHFVSFNPTSDDFHRGRLAMDGVMPDGTTIPFVPGARGQGFNAVLKTTHRQNFLVPPRAHRSFPLVEFRS
jgi:hypothetical protein